ncbi:hypothetical protein HDU76_011341 [Blyttiomyces sp. JEL0837]|nr:hypothetical protein HDU76_011341 [Blyttiomyces sp. JEL0837]
MALVCRCTSTAIRIPGFGTRTFFTSSPLRRIDPNLQQQSGVQMVFDRELKKAQRNRAALHPNTRDVDYLKDEVANRLVDRLLDIKRRFSKCLDLGSGPGYIYRYADKTMMDHLVQLDSAENQLFRDKDQVYEVSTERVVADEELLPFPENTFDCILSSLSMHWINDLPGALIQAKKALKPDGVFIGAMMGGETLYELRTSFQLTELERLGGVSPRVSPMTDVRDVSALLNRAGFTLTTNEIVVRYPSMFELLYDLQAMGENNAVIHRNFSLGKDVLYAAAEAYQSIYGTDDGSIPATFQIIYMIGWKPDPSQPKPLKRGSGEVSLKKVLDATPSSEPK